MHIQGFEGETWEQITTFLKQPVSVHIEVHWVDIPVADHQEQEALPAPGPDRVQAARDDEQGRQRGQVSRCQAQAPLHVEESSLSR